MSRVDLKHLKLEQDKFEKRKDELAKVHHLAQESIVNHLDQLIRQGIDEGLTGLEQCIEKSSDKTMRVINFKINHKKQTMISINRAAFEDLESESLSSFLWIYTADLPYGKPNIAIKFFQNYTEKYSCQIYLFKSKHPIYTEKIENQDKTYRNIAHEIFGLYYEFRSIWGDEPTLEKALSKKESHTFGF